MGNIIGAEEEGACAGNPSGVPTRSSLAPAILALAITVLPGCSLTGGGIPPGDTGGSISVPTGVVNGRLITGRVQSALPPYSPITSATVTIQAPTGGAVAPPTPVDGDGRFSFSNVPYGFLMLQVKVNSPTLQGLLLPIQPLPQPLIQFVASAAPAAPTAAESLTLETDNLQPFLHQMAHVKATLGGASAPGLAPSWAAYGVAGYLTAAGPLASFDAQAPGPESLYAISGTATATVQLTVPSSLAYANPPSTQNPNIGAGSGGSTAGSGGNQIVSNRHTAEPTSP